MDNKTLIIAEAGVNHNGDIELAKRLIDVSAKANVDFVKFQTFRADTLVSKKAKKADYQVTNTKSSESQYNLLKKLELSPVQHEILIEYASSQGVRFFSTAFDIEGLEYLNSLGFSVFKSPSGEITNYPYLRKLSELGKPVILSTGMAKLSEIKDAIEVLTSDALTLDDITVLHCNTEYPTPFEDVNLKAMQTIADQCGVKVGYSDHTLGIEVPIAAVALGATVIEKHFTLNRAMEGPDHAASLEPNELIQMVQGIRNIEKAIAGNGIKVPSKSESRNIAVARKSLHLSKNLEIGHIISEKDLLTLRPGDGINPMKWSEVIGKSLKDNFPKFHKLKEEDLQ